VTVELRVAKMKATETLVFSTSDPPKLPLVFVSKAPDFLPTISGSLTHRTRVVEPFEACLVGSCDMRGSALLHHPLTVVIEAGYHTPGLRMMNPPTGV